MSAISFMSANYVARQLDYHMTEGWEQGDRATQDYFRPLATFEPRFEALLQEISGLGFCAMDLWLAHLHPAWATDEHISIAQRLLARYEMPVVSLAGGFGNTPEEFEASCRLAAGVGTRVLGGGSGLLTTDRDRLVSLLDEYDLLLGVENHPEKTPDELLAHMGDAAHGRIGATVDTGIFTAQGYSAPAALVELASRLMHVHLKDVTEVGAHRTCAFGEGVANVEECVEALEAIGYDGVISVEHEPEDHDPGPECEESRILLEGWLHGT